VVGRAAALRRHGGGDVAGDRAAGRPVKRIAEIIAHMGRITRLEVHGSTPNIPPMLDIRKSSPSQTR
jgi:hypothetical protein